MSKIANFRDNLAFVLSSERGLRTQVARAIDTSPVYLTHLVAGRNEPGLAIAVNIADALGYSVDELLLLPAHFRRLVSQRQTVVPTRTAKRSQKNLQTSTKSR